MARDDERYTAAEWEHIRDQYRDQPKRGVRAMYPDPHHECGLAPLVPTPDPGFQPHPHVRTFFASFSEDDVKKFQTILDMRTETIGWLSSKSPRELKSLDGAVEFVTSSRTAAKVLAWCFVTAGTAFGLVVAAAKNGIDLFQLIRGGKG